MKIANASRIGFAAGLLAVCVHNLACAQSAANATATRVPVTVIREVRQAGSPARSITEGFRSDVSSAGIYPASSDFFRSGLGNCGSSVRDCDACQWPD